MAGRQSYPVQAWIGRVLHRVLGVMFFGMLVACLAWPSAGRAETWRIVSEDDVPPFVYRQGGKVTGLDYELVQAVLASMQVEGEYRDVPWNRMTYMLDHDHADLGFSFVQAAPFDTRYILVGPLRTGRFGFVGVAGSRIEYQKLAELKRFVLATVQGYAYSSEFDTTPLQKDTTATSQLLLLRKLLAERDDLIAGDVETLKVLAGREGVMRRITFIPKLIAEAPRYVAFPNSHPERAAAFAAALARVKAAGGFDPIFARYHADHVEPALAGP